MFRKLKGGSPCGKYEARLEDFLHGANDPTLAAHVAQCPGCRAALDDSNVAGALLRDAWAPADEPHSYFLPGVMARIREEKLRLASPAAFWNPLEFLASRVSLAAAVLLLAVSVYLAGFAPRKIAAPAAQPASELAAADFPQPPGDPVSNEEVLQSLMERDYGH